jgi:hypothetical protein
MENARTDMENSYRRGYVQGANAVFMAVADKLPAADAKIIRDFIDRELTTWRFELHENPPSAAKNKYPPVLRL